MFTRRKNIRMNILHGNGCKNNPSEYIQTYTNASWDFFLANKLGHASESSAIFLFLVLKSEGYDHFSVYRQCVKTILCGLLLPHDYYCFSYFRLAYIVCLEFVLHRPFLYFVIVYCKLCRQLQYTKPCRPTSPFHHHIGPILSY